MRLLVLVLLFAALALAERPHCTSTHDCPYPQGVCCPDRQSCCPQGYKCALAPEGFKSHFKYGCERVGKPHRVELHESPLTSSHGALDSVLMGEAKDEFSPASGILKIESQLADLEQLYEIEKTAEGHKANVHALAGVERELHKLQQKHPLEYNTEHDNDEIANLKKEIASLEEKESHTLATGEHHASPAPASGVEAVENEHEREFAAAVAHMEAEAAEAKGASTGVQGESQAADQSEAGEEEEDPDAEDAKEPLSILAREIAAAESAEHEEASSKQASSGDAEDDDEEGPLLSASASGAVSPDSEDEDESEDKPTKASEEGEQQHPLEREDAEKKEHDEEAKLESRNAEALALKERVAALTQELGGGEPTDPKVKAALEFLRERIAHLEGVSAISNEHDHAKSLLDTLSGEQSAQGSEQTSGEGDSIEFAGGNADEESTPEIVTAEESAPSEEASAAANDGTEGSVVVEADAVNHGEGEPIASDDHAMEAEVVTQVSSVSKSS